MFGIVIMAQVIGVMRVLDDMGRLLPNRQGIAGEERNFLNSLENTHVN